MKRTRSDDDLRLRELLRRGDPAQGGEPLDPQDLARMRREILGTVEASGTATRLVDWRWVAVATCVVIVVVMGWHLRNLPVHPPAVPAPPGMQASSTPDGVTPEGTSAPLVVGVDPIPAVPAAVASSGTDQARTLHFTTRRGTQIIWTIDPELEL